MSGGGERWQEIGEAVFSAATRNVIRLVGALGELASNKVQKDSIVDKYLDDENVKSLEDLVNRELQQNYTYTERISIESNPALYQQVINHYQPLFKALEETREKLKKDVEELNSILNAPVSVADISTIGLERQSEKFNENLTAARKELKATRDLSDELFKSTHNDFENRQQDLSRWRHDLLNAETTTAQQRELIEQIYATKSAKIEQERVDKLQEIRESVAAADRTELENRIAAILKEKDSWIQAGMEKAEAEVLAERLKLDAIETANDEAVAALGAIYQTSLEQRLAQIEKEKQAWIDKGVEEVKATQWAEQAKVDAQRNAAMSVLKSQIEEYRSFSEGGYEGLMKHRRDELFKSGISPEDLQMTPQQLEAFQKAQDTVERNLLPNFATAYDRAEDRRLRDNQYVDEQRKTADALDKFLQHQEGNRLYESLNNDDVRRLLSMPVMDKSALPSAETLDAMYQPINKTAEEFQTLIPQLEGAKETLEGFSAVEQPAIASIPAPETPVVTPPTPAKPELDTSALNQPITDVTEMFTAMSSALDDVTGKITDLGTIIGEAIESIPQIDTVVETPDLTVDTSQLFSAFEELVSPMSEVNAQFGEMAGKLLEVTSGLSELVGALNNLKAQPQAQQQQQVVTPPPNITVTVQIEEAHAWDSQHIQELADKVADRIEPELVNAIGGDSNRY